MSSRRRRNGKEIIEIIEERDPELATAIRELAEQENKLPEEFIVEAIRSWYHIRQTVLANMSTEQLLVAFDFWDHVYRRALQAAFASVGLWQTLAQVFAAFMELYSTIYGSAKQAADEQHRQTAMERLFNWMERFMEKMEKRMEIMFMANPFMRDLFGGVNVPNTRRNANADRAEKDAEIRVEG